MEGAGLPDWVEVGQGNTAVKVGWGLLTQDLACSPPACSTSREAQALVAWEATSWESCFRKMK